MLEETNVLAALQRCPLFAGLAEPDLRRAADALRPRRFRRDEVIFHAGDPAGSLHVIGSGAVKIAVASPEGEEAIIATLGAGDFFGELALLDGAPRSATATAVGATATLEMPRPAFIALLEEPTFRNQLLVAVASELRRLTSNVEELHFLDLGGRLAGRIARMAASVEAEADGAVRLDWPYTQSDLASMIGGTRQSVNRLLGQFVARDLLRIERDALIVPDPARLAREAER